MKASATLTRSVVSTAAALVVLALPVFAQSAQPWSLQGSVLVDNQSINGKLISGAGFEGMLRYTPSVWSVGLGYQYSTHSSNGETLNLSGIFVEPRYALDIGSDRVAPYLAGRVGILKQSSTLRVAGDVSSNGTAFGGGAGFLIRASKTVNFDIGAAFVQQSFGDAKGSGNTTVTFKSFTGYVAKGGISIGFGGK